MESENFFSLFSTMEDGLLCALTYRHTARLYATYSLLTLALPTHWDDKKTLTDALKGDRKKMHILVLLKRIRDNFVWFSEVCSEHSSEDNLETVASNLPTKEFVIPQGTLYIIIVKSIFFVYSVLPPSPHLFSFPPDVASHLQGHCHWLVEMAVKVVSAITKGTSDTVSFAVT